MKSFAFVAGLLSLLLQRHTDIVSSAPTYEHAALQAADQCDWIGSGGGERGVRPVYLRCSRGTVIWRYPRGAIRVVFSPPVLTESLSQVDVEFVEQDTKRNGRANRSVSSDISRLSGFRACTKVSGPIRVYLESHGKLRTLYTPRDGKHKASHRCFYATATAATTAAADTGITAAPIGRQPAALYIEAEEQPILGEHRDVKLQYDLEIRRRRRWRPQRRRRRQQVNDDSEVRYRLYNEEEEEDCRPCSTEELAKAYCQSDLVARGTVNAVEKQLNLEATELVVGVTKILRRIEENEGNNDADVTELYDRKNVRVRVPSICDARHGQGEFVIMAKRRLGDLILVCAPRLETWTITVRELETAPCVLRS